MVPKKEVVSMAEIPELLIPKKMWSSDGQLLRKDEAFHSLHCSSMSEEEVRTFCLKKKFAPFVDQEKVRFLPVNISGSVSF